VHNVESVVDNENAIKFMKKYVAKYKFGTLTEEHFHKFTDAFAAVLLERYVNQLAIYMLNNGGSGYFSTVPYFAT
jgi:aminopeptidase N